NWKSQDISLFFGRADGSFDRVPSVASLNSPAYTLAVTDLNHDGHPDLVTGDLGGLVYLLYNDGAGGFRAAPPLRAGLGLRCLTVADLNGDKLDDIITANTSADSVTIFFAKPDGTFAPPHNIAVGHQPRWVTAADVNGDGVLDLVVTNGG